MDTSTVTIKFRNIKSELLLRNSYGFEALINDEWQDVRATRASSNSVTLSLSSSNHRPTMIRYLWFQAPCFPDQGIQNCAIYDKDSNLPATPFIIEVV